MQLIMPSEIQRMLDLLKDQDIYLHLELTSGAYAAHTDVQRHAASTFISNGKIRYSHGAISGRGPYRVGLKMEEGWVFSEGLTHWEDQDQERLILAGHDQDGKLVVSLQLSREPFQYGKEEL
ncbi:YojF family protein [Paenibacillus sp. JX-17]|uniref:YojF family protein n=1 Tax=Paenibacillus lacisoli TaxID=3064525 RepID=A0ABT9CG07_9BACL|nr:YojF family protein [Paenibacillus sp. JX-17]MDO7908210.1 YojF family protein [Paenibacillus sp. JX-17]